MDLGFLGYCFAKPECSVLAESQHVWIKGSMSSYLHRNDEVLHMNDLPMKIILCIFTSTLLQKTGLRLFYSHIRFI